MVNWPSSSSVPQIPLIQGFSETFPNVVVRTSMDAGPAKVRRRFTAAERPFKLNMILTAAQATAFDTFFVTTVAGGSLPFTWVHPRTQEAADFRFVGQPTYSALDGGLYQVDFTIELLP
jgi:hypothetical protein